MGKARKNKFYAVRKGREGPRIYSSWEAAKENIYKYPGAVQKSFATQREAEEWLNVAPDLSHTYVPGLPLSMEPCSIGTTRVKHRRKDRDQKGTKLDDPTSRLHPLTVNAAEDGIRDLPKQEECDNADTSGHTKMEEGPGVWFQIKTEPVDALTTMKQGIGTTPSLQIKGETLDTPLPELKLEDINTPPPPTIWEEDSIMASQSTDPTSSPRHLSPTLSDPPPPPVTLSAEQWAVLRMVMSGQNVFFTGSAGTGKSVLLREIINHCCARDPDTERLAITAATGIASVNIGGCTLHSWAGVGLAKEPADQLLGKILGQDKNERVKAERERAGRERAEQERAEQERAERVKDLEEVGHTNTEMKMPVRSQEKPKSCGRGIVRRWKKVRTLIVDEISMIDGVLFDKLEFLGQRLRKNDQPFGGIQLVLSGDFFQLPPVPDLGNHGVSIPATFAFEARSWSRCFGKPVVLRHVFRQSDQDFVDMLNSVRLGRLTPQITAEFMKLSRRVTYDDGIEPTDLFPIRREAERENSLRLRQLDDPHHVYLATDRPGVDNDHKPYPFSKVKPGLDRLVAPKEITLKVGAQVMLIKNLVQGQLVNGSLGRVVAFSTPRDARKCGTDIAKEAPNGPEKQKPDQHTLQVAENYIWPIVEFRNGHTLLCIPATFEAINADGRVEATRHQIPLILAWALSIHKSQGQTLERVRVDLGRVFENGQAYVALSRATSLDGLEVHGFNPLKVRAHPRVIQWMKENIDEDVGSKAQELADEDDDRQYWDKLE